MIARYDKHYEGQVQRVIRTCNVLHQCVGGWVQMCACVTNLPAEAGESFFEEMPLVEK